MPHSPCRPVCDCYRGSRRLPDGNRALSPEACALIKFPLLGTNVSLPRLCPATQDTNVIELALATKRMAAYPARSLKAACSDCPTFQTLATTMNAQSRCYTCTSHQSGQRTLCGVRVALYTTCCSSRVSSRSPRRTSAASTTQGSSMRRAVGR